MGPVESAGALSIGLGTVLTVAGIGKVRAGSTRVQATVLAYDLLPPSVAAFVGRGLPYVEIGIGVLVLAGLAFGPAAIAAASLLTVFTGVVAVALARGTTSACGCFGRTDLRPLRRTVVLRNLLLLGVAVCLFIWPQPPLTLDGLLAAEGVDDAARYALGAAVAATVAIAVAASTWRRDGFLLVRESATGGDKR